MVLLVCVYKFFFTYLWWSYFLCPSFYYSFHRLIKKVNGQRTDNWFCQFSITKLPGKVISVNKLVISYNTDSPEYSQKKYCYIIFDMCDKYVYQIAAHLKSIALFVKLINCHKYKYSPIMMSFQKRLIIMFIIITWLSHDVHI